MVKRKIPKILTGTCWWKRVIPSCLDAMMWSHTGIRCVCFSLNPNAVVFSDPQFCTMWLFLAISPALPSTLSYAVIPHIDGLGRGLSRSHSGCVGTELAAQGKAQEEDQPCCPGVLCVPQRTCPHWASTLVDGRSRKETEAVEMMGRMARPHTCISKTITHLCSN